MRVNLIKIWIAFFAVPLFGQDGIPYLDFNLRQSGGGIEVSWVVQAGNFCQDVEIWRGTDSNALAQVYVYPGICGDNDSAKHYQFVDRPPSSGIRYFYRIVIITDKTEIKPILNLPETGLSIYPNPAQEQFQVIHNPASGIHILRLLDLQGKVLWEIKDPESEISLPVDHLPRGHLILEYETGTQVGYERVFLSN